MRPKMGIGSMAFARIGTGKEIRWHQTEGRSMENSL